MSSATSLSPSYSCCYNTAISFPQSQAWRPLCREGLDLHHAVETMLQKWNFKITTMKKKKSQITFLTLRGFLLGIIQTAYTLLKEKEHRDCPAQPTEQFGELACTEQLHHENLTLPVMPVSDPKHNSEKQIQANTTSGNSA